MEPAAGKPDQQRRSKSRIERQQIELAQVDGVLTQHFAGVTLLDVEVGAAAAGRLEREPERQPLRGRRPSRAPHVQPEVGAPAVGVAA
jgi:hypothetical protein